MILLVAFSDRIVEPSRPGLRRDGFTLGFNVDRRWRFSLATTNNLNFHLNPNNNARQTPPRTFGTTPGTHLHNFARHGESFDSQYTLTLPSPVTARSKTLRNHAANKNPKYPASLPTRNYPASCRRPIRKHHSAQVKPENENGSPSHLPLSILRYCSQRSRLCRRRGRTQFRARSGHPGSLSRKQCALGS